MNQSASKIAMHTVDCPFCLIARGETETVLVREWPEAIVFEPLNPVAPGHKLVVPRAHVEDATEDPALTGIVFQRAAEFARTVGSDCNIITSIGEDATQTVFHLHVHVVPRHAGDDLPLPWTPQHRREGRA